MKELRNSAGVGSHEPQGNENTPSSHTHEQGGKKQSGDFFHVCASMHFLIENRFHII
jgi:hypothetical protein